MTVIATVSKAFDSVWCRLAGFDCLCFLDGFFSGDLEGFEEKGKYAFGPFGLYPADGLKAKCFRCMVYLILLIFTSGRYSLTMV